MATRLSFDELHAVRPRDPFDATDVLVKVGTKRIVRAFSRLRSRLAVCGEDPYLVMLYVDEAYEEAWQAYRACLTSAYSRAYKSVLPRGAPMAERAFSDYVSTAEEPEGYVPRAEWERKRDRCKEAVLAAFHAGVRIGPPIAAAKRLAVGQMAQGADGMTDAALLDAYMDADVERVRLVTKRDAHVCEDCRRLGGMEFDADKAPHLPLHHNCRCFYVPA